MREVNEHTRTEYQTDRLIPGDCLEIMQDIPDDTFDMSFADPPFNLGKRYSNYKDGRMSDEYVAWCREWIGEMVRVTKPTGSILVPQHPEVVDVLQRDLERNGALQALDRLGRDEQSGW